MSQLVMVYGKKETGKSTTIAQLAMALRRKTLIIDPGEAPVYREYGFKKIDPREVLAFSRTPESELTGSSKVRRISNIVNKKQLVARVFGFDLERDQVDIRRGLINANIIFEDAASYINSYMSQNLLECIKGMKQRGLNLVLTYHSISETSEQLMRLSPDKLIFKKTGDKMKVFSKIKKTEFFDRYDAAAEAYYKAQFYGLYPDEILASIKRHVKGVAFDLDYKKPLHTDAQKSSFAKWLCAYANGKSKPSEAQRKMLRYQVFGADMRFQI
ncbi:MAG: hypothetical protein AAF927_01675 [Bacteroidota bacterium]